MPVLAFHKLSDKLTFGVTNYQPARFERLLNELRAWGNNFGPDESCSGSNTISFTFDDGYSHLAEILPALIERFQISATICLPTAYIGKENSWDYSSILASERHLDKREIRQLHSLGVAFASHGHRHVALTSLDEKSLRHECVESKSVLEDIIGAPVTALSYPFGRVNRRVMDIAAETGFAVGYTMAFPNGADSALAQGRIAVYNYDTMASVRRKLSSGPWQRIERAKSRITNALSGGTVLWQRLGRTLLLD